MHGRKRCGIVRTTISLPWELHRRMRHCGRDVNWSAVAAKAFSEEVERRAAQQNDGDIDEVVARLRGSLGPSQSDLFRQGIEHGEKWAREQATAVELGRLHRAKRHARFEHRASHQNWLAAVDEQHAPAEVLAKIIGRENLSGVGSEDPQLWKSTEYVHGFAGGAIHIWKQVARRLRGGF